MERITCQGLVDTTHFDVMHVEKNICESLYGTMLSIDGKNKDISKARDDLKEWGIRPELHFQQTFELGDYQNDLVLRRIIDVQCATLHTNWKCKLHKHYRRIRKDVSDPGSHPLYPCNAEDWAYMIKNV